MVGRTDAMRFVVDDRADGSLAAFVAGTDTISAASVANLIRRTVVVRSAPDVDFDAASDVPIAYRLRWTSTLVGTG